MSDGLTTRAETWMGCSACVAVGEAARRLCCGWLWEESGLILILRWCWTR
jgi:hypothetical protein